MQRVESLYEDSRACLRRGKSTRQCFGVRRGLRQECVMSLWLFNVFFIEWLEG